MANRLTTAQSTVAMRRWNPPAIVTLVALTALTALATEAAAKQARPAAPTEATAPRDAGEPIMAIVSIKSQQVTFYDSEGWILRAPVSPWRRQAAPSVQPSQQASQWREESNDASSRWIAPSVIDLPYHSRLKCSSALCVDQVSDPQPLAGTIGTTR